MHEPDVTLTDYALAVECAVLVGLLGRGGGRLRAWFAVLFGSVGAAALLGGTVHGFLPDPQSPVHRAAWAATLLAIGVSALAAWSIGGALIGPPAFARGVERFALVELLAYAAVVLFVSTDFLVALVDYLPAAALMLAGLVLRWRTARNDLEPRPYRLAATGLALTLVAAGVQAGRLTLHPDWFDHNALYHVLQGIALLLLFLGARHLSDATVVPAC